LKDQINHIDRVIPLGSAQNVRDLGGYVTESGHTTRWRQFVRAGDMDKVSDADQAQLKDYGIKVVIDLRMKREVAEAPNVFTGSDQVDVVIHDFWGDRFDHYRSRRKDVSGAEKLADLYCAGLVESGFVMAEIMNTLATSADQCYAFHCRSGKDRTGLVAALLLAIAGVPEEVICADYALTEALLISPDADKQIDPNQPGYYLRTCEPETMAQTLGFLKERYGSASAYLMDQGVSQDSLNLIREKLLGES